MAVVSDYLSEGVDEMPARDRRHESAAAFPLLEQWLTYLEFEGKAPRTINSYERAVAGLLREYPTLGFAEFTDAHVMKALGRVPQRSRYISRSIYTGWFEWGEMHDHREGNPMRKVPKLRAGERRPTGLFTEAEVALLTSLPSPDGALLALMFGALLRREDCIKLQRRHIDLDNLRVMIYNGKGGKDAVIPITPETAGYVADLDLIERLAPDDYLWTRTKKNRTRKTPIGYSQFSRWWADVIARSGVRYLKPHTTRHTGHWLLKHVEHMDLEMRQIVLRHNSPETTVRQYPVTDVEDVARARAAYRA